MGVKDFNMKTPAAILARHAAAYHAIRAALATLPMDRSAENTTTAQAAPPTAAEFTRDPSDGSLVVPQAIVDQFLLFVNRLVTCATTAAGENPLLPVGEARMRIIACIIHAVLLGSEWRALRRVALERDAVNAVMNLVRFPHDGINSETNNNNARLFATLGNLVFEPAGKLQVVQHPSFEESFVAALTDAHASVCGNAARAVFSGATVDANKPKFAFAIPHLVRLIRHSDRSVATNALGALGNLLVYPDNKPRVLECGAIASLMETALDPTTSEGVLNQTMRCAYSLAAYVPARPAFFVADCLNAIRRVLTGSATAETKAHASGFLSNLMITEFERVPAEYLFSVVAPNIGTETAALRAAMIHIVYSLSDKPAIRAAFSAPDTVRALTEAFKAVSEDARATHEAAGLLANFCIGNSLTKQIVIQNGGMSAAIAWMRRPPPTDPAALANFKLAMRQTALLSFALVRSDSAKSEFANSGGVEALVQAVETVAECAENAMGALSNVALLCPDRVLRARAFPHMLRCLLKSENVKAKAQAFRGIPSLVEYCRASAALEELAGAARRPVENEVIIPPAKRRKL